MTRAEQQQRIGLLSRLGAYMTAESEDWLAVQQRALDENGWFTEAQISFAIAQIAGQYLDIALLEEWITPYPLPAASKKVGIVMAGNIPLVGFHDFLCGFISGHRLYLKLSVKDTALLSHVIQMLISWEPELEAQLHIAERLNNCEAYIATGSNNTSRYFEAYFGKHPNIIRRNRTSVAILDGTETDEELRDLAKDAFTYYGLGCRNVTQLCVPEGYDFVPLLRVFKEEEWLKQHHKFGNNYDYHLALYLLNRVPYFTNEIVLLVENELPFAAVSVLHYRYYKDRDALADELLERGDVQAIIGHEFLPFGAAQSPGLADYADGVDTLAFLSGL